MNKTFLTLAVMVSMILNFTLLYQKHSLEDVLVKSQDRWEETIDDWRVTIDSLRDCNDALEVTIPDTLHKIQDSAIHLIENKTLDVNSTRTLDVNSTRTLDVNSTNTSDHPDGAGQND